MSLLWRRRRDLHPDQIRAIEDLPATGKYLLVGPPGSGKTSILLHRGQYLRLAPHLLTNSRLVTFTRTLREFIAVDGDERFPAALVQTFWEFVDEIFVAYGETPPTFEQGVAVDQKNRVRAERALRLIEEKGLRVGVHTLLVDETQDLCREEVQLVDRITGRIMFAGDARQRLFEARGGLEEADVLGCELVELKHHFRISPDICRVADSILTDPNYRLADYEHYQGPTPSPPSAKGNLNREQQMSELISIIDLQLDTYNERGDLIGVIAYRKDDCDFIYGALKATRFADQVRLYHSDVRTRQFDELTRVCVLTVQSCKGLEFRAVHWLFADADAFHITQQRAYTVVTRAKSSLTVYYDKSLPAFLAGAFPPGNRRLFDDEDE